MAKRIPGSVGWAPARSCDEPNVHLLDDDDSQASTAIRELFRLNQRRSAPTKASVRARYEALSPVARRVVDLYLAAHKAGLLLEQLGFGRMDSRESGALVYRELVRALDGFLGPDEANDEGGSP